MEEDSNTISNPKRSAQTNKRSSAYARKRAVIACRVCRARRTKCDQKKPACSFCQSIGAECVSDPPALSAFDPASLAIIQRLDKLQQEFNQFATALPLKGALSPFSPRVLSNGRPAHVLQQNLDQILQWPVFRACCPSVSPQVHFSSLVSYASQGKVMGLSLATDHLIDGGPHLSLVDQFFSHVHNRNPILGEAKTRGLVQEAHERGIGWDTESCLTLLVYANGALARPLSPSPQLPLSQEELECDQANALYLAAEQRLGPVLATTGIMQAQCLFLAGVFLMSALRPFDALRMFMQSLTMCRTIKRTKKYDTTDMVAIESIYWSAWKSERELTRELWSSPEAWRHGYEHPQQFPCLPSNCEGENLYTWYFYLSEISAWRLQTHAEAELTRFAAEGGGSLESFIAVADSLMQQVIEWQNSLTPNVSISHDGNDNDMLKVILRARIGYVQDVISWPFVYALVHDGVEPDSTTVRKWTTKGLSCHMQKLQNHRVQFYYRHHGTWLMIRSCARSAGILIAAAKQGFWDMQLPDNWREAVDSTIQMLDFWRPYVIDLQEAIDRVTALYSQL